MFTSSVIYGCNPCLFVSFLIKFDFFFDWKSSETGINVTKAISGATKAVSAATLTDEQMTEYVAEYIAWMDEHNQVCADDNEYTIRLKKLTEGLSDADGIPLNFKVYYVTDVNAFACADGSVRVFSSLMDIMTDEELLGVIGHEIGFYPSGFGFENQTDGGTGYRRRN